MLSNTATVSSPNDRTNASDTEETMVVAEVELSITKEDNPDPVLVGQNLTYTLTVTNSGDDEAEDVTVMDPLPDGATFVSATPSQGSCTHSGGIVTCDLGELDEGRSATVTIVVRPTQAGTITNTVRASAKDSDPATATATTTVVTAANLSITKEDDPDPVLVGDDLAYTLTVSNNGPSDATDVTVNDELPGNVEFVSAEASQGSPDACDEQAGVVTCDLGDIGNGDTATVEIVVTPTAAGTIENTAEVSSATDDPDTTNNEATELTTVDENDDGGDGDDGDDGDGGDDGDNGSDGDEGTTETTGTETTGITRAATMGTTMVTAGTTATTTYWRTVST